MLNEIITRRSVRKFKKDPVTREQLDSILEAARLAPSGNNAQPWRFLVITDEETKRRIVEADHDQQWMLDAPVFIACMGDLSARTHEETAAPLDEDSPSMDVKRIIRDTAVAIAYMTLEIERLGLATCWTGWYLQSDMRAALGIPDGFFTVGVLPVGYPGEAPDARPRIAAEDMVRYERWS